MSFTEQINNLNTVYTIIWDIDKAKRIIVFFYTHIGKLLNIYKTAERLGLSFESLFDTLRILEKNWIFHIVDAYYSDIVKENHKYIKVYCASMNYFEIFYTDFFIRHVQGTIVENQAFLKIYEKAQEYWAKVYSYRHFVLGEIDFIFEYEDKSIIPIEIKSTNSISIPPLFYEFQKNYWKRCKFFIKSTMTKVKRKRLGEENMVMFLPNQSINQLL